MELGHRVRGRAWEKQCCVAAAAAGGFEGWNRLESALFVTSAYMKQAVIPILPFAGTSICLSQGLWQDWAGGKTVLLHTLACFSRQLHTLIMPRVG